MMETYQPIYDAIRSRVTQCDVTSVIEDVARNAFDMSQARQWAMEAAGEAARPSVLFRPTLSLDGNQWCALYGPNLQEGCAGFGTSPDAAMRAFDEAWTTKVTP